MFLAASSHSLQFWINYCCKERIKTVGFAMFWVNKGSEIHRVLLAINSQPLINSNMSINVLNKCYAWIKLHELSFAVQDAVLLYWSLWKRWESLWHKYSINTATVVTVYQKTCMKHHFEDPIPLWCNIVS